MLVQIAARKGRIDRIPNGQEPVIELHLEPRQYVTRLDISDNRYSNGDRKTFDAWWTAWVATPLGDTAGEDGASHGR